MSCPTLPLFPCRKNHRRRTMQQPPGRRETENFTHRHAAGHCTYQNAKANTRQQEQASGKQAVEVQPPASRGANGKNNSKRSR